MADIIRLAEAVAAEISVPGEAEVIVKGQGGYTGEPKEVLYCVVTRLEVDKLKEIVLEKDENAFVTINAVHDIVGGRFKKKAIH